MSKVTIEIDEWIRCRLVWLLRMCGHPLGDGLEPLDELNTGAWTSDALKQLTEGLPDLDASQVKSHESRDEIRRKLEMWARKDKGENDEGREVFTLEWDKFEEREAAGRILVEWDGMLETLKSVSEGLRQNGKDLREYDDKLEARARECAGWAVSDLAEILVMAARTRDADLAMDRLTHQVKRALELAAEAEAEAEV